MCALLSRERDSAKSFFLPIHGRGGRVRGSKLHYRAHRGNIQKRHLYIGINRRYNIYLGVQDCTVVDYILVNKKCRKEVEKLRKKYKKVTRSIEKKLENHKDKDAAKRYEKKFE